MPGGGVTARNVARIFAAASPRELHFAALTRRARPHAVPPAHVFMGGELRAPEYERRATTAAGIGLHHGGGQADPEINAGPVPVAGTPR